MDDVWISGHLARNGVPRLVVPADEDQFTAGAKLTNVTTLDHINGRGRSQPDARAKANKVALRYFAADWDVEWNVQHPPVFEVRPRRRR